MLSGDVPRYRGGPHGARKAVGGPPATGDLARFIWQLVVGQVTVSSTLILNCLFLTPPVYPHHVHNQADASSEGIRALTSTTYKRVDEHASAIQKLTLV